MEEIKSKIGSGIFIQIGAGAGDRDPRANFRDGFSELVKSLPRDRIKKIILVEPNPVNIYHLNICWNEYSNAEIHQVAIVPKNLSGTKLNFYYCVNDGPHYQVASINRDHVIKHYETAEISDIKIISVDGIDLETFLVNTIGNENIELLSLDIEGIDSDILLDIDFTKLNISYLSYEYLHNGNKEPLIQEKLKHYGYIFKGYGVDHGDYDYLWYNNNT